MEITVSKQAATVNCTLFEQSTEQAIDTDFTLPDYCPDIERVLKCRVVPRLISKSISGDTLNIDGVATATLIYCDSEGKLCGFEHEVPFKKSVTVGSVGENSCIFVSLVPDYMNCRAVTQRKMDIHGVISVKIKITGTESREIITDAEAEGIQLKSGSCPATSPLGFSEKNVMIEEELELGRGSAAVRSVLRSDARAVVDECKMVGNKAVIKGDVVVNALYCTEEGTTELYENRIPFNQVLELGVEGENCRCEARVQVLSCLLRPRTNLSGEAKSLAAECRLSVMAFASCDNDIPVLYDAFCTKHELKLTTADIAVKKLESTLSERYMCKKTLDFSENTFGSVVDLWCESKVGKVQITGGVLTVDGTVNICFIALDTENMPQYYERSVDFEYTHNIDCDSKELTAMADIALIGAAYTVLSESRLEVRVELGISAGIYLSRKECVITDLEMSDEPIASKKRAPLMVYFAESGEQVWDISKRYGANCGDLMTVNELKEETLTRPTMLLIP